MNGIDVLLDALARSTEVCHDTVDGLDAETVNRQPTPRTNSISWLVWHIARQQDAQIAALNGKDEVWTANGWADRFGLDLPTEAMGYGQGPADVAKVRVDDPALLVGYLDDAADATTAYIRSLSEADLDEVIDTSWDPPVTRGVRVISIADDAAQHAGQAAYLRGLFAESDPSEA